MEAAHNYIVTGRNRQGTLTFAFAEEGQLVFFDSDMELDAETSRAIITHCTTLDEFVTRMNKSPNFYFRPAILDITFKNFWAMYRHKIGRKKAEEGWKKLKKAKKIKAITAIQQYDNNLRMNPTKPKLHASTYLNQERFEDEF